MSDEELFEEIAKGKLRELKTAKQLLLLAVREIELLSDEYKAGFRECSFESRKREQIHELIDEASESVMGM